MGDYMIYILLAKHWKNTREKMWRRDIGRNKDPRGWQYVWLGEGPP